MPARGRFRGAQNRSPANFNDIGPIRIAVEREGFSARFKHVAPPNVSPVVVNPQLNGPLFVPQQLGDIHAEYLRRSRPVGVPARRVRFTLELPTSYARRSEYHDTRSGLNSIGLRLRDSPFEGLHCRRN